MTKPDPQESDRRPPARRELRGSGVVKGTSYPYIHPEALHPAPLAVDADSLLEYIEHFGDEGPDIVSDVQPG